MEQLSDQRLKQLACKASSHTIQALAEEGLIEGYASRFHIEDSEHDIVLPGAYKRTLQHQRQSKRPYLYPFLFQHDPAQIIGGIIEAYEDHNGLFYRARCNLETRLGRECYSNARQGLLYQTSIGYDVPGAGAEYRQGKRYLKEIRLWEISLVTFAANPQALVTQVKAQSGAEAPLSPQQYALILRSLDSIGESCHQIRTLLHRLPLTTAQMHDGYDHKEAVPAAEITAQLTQLLDTVTQTLARQQEGKDA
jgi:HK97 family phage prohead protease